MSKNLIIYQEFILDLYNNHVIKTISTGEFEKNTFTFIIKFNCNCKFKIDLHYLIKEATKQNKFNLFVKKFPYLIN